MASSTSLREASPQTRGASHGAADAIQAPADCRLVEGPAPQRTRERRPGRALLRTPLVGLLSLAAPLLLWPASCKSLEDHRDEADEEVYELIAERGEALLSGAAEFTIRIDPDALRSRIDRGEVTRLDDMTLEDALVLAADNSREYQTRKERLYLAALDVTLQRWRFSLQEGGSFDASANGVGSEAGTGAGGFFGSLSQLLGSGARVLGDIGLSVARNLGSSDDWTVFTDIGFDITQPLLRDAGRLVTTEPLTQAQRTLLYEVRAFERFRRELAVDVARQIYGLLQQGEFVRNQRANAESLKLTREKNEALAEAGRQSEIQVDQARQNELRSRDALLEVQRQLENRYDSFKLFLNLPIDFEIGLDRGLLAQLTEAGVGDTIPDEATAVETALAQRLDLMTARDRTVDAARRVLIAENALEAGFDLQASFNLTSDPNQPLDLDLGDATWNLSSIFRLPINQLPERNAYRGGLIAVDQAQRNLREFADSIVTALRAELRTIAATRQSYEIQKGAVVLAERRVESAKLSLDAGRAETRDLLEAQSALLEAQNAVTRALIDYSLARLALYRDMGTLRLEGGTIEFLATAADGGTHSPTGESRS